MKFSLDFNEDEELCQYKVFIIDSEPMKNPASFKSILLDVRVATPILDTAVCEICSTNVVVVPSTIRFPAILTVPVVTPS